MWVWIVVGAVIAVVLIVAMNRRAKHRAAERDLRSHFPHIAHDRLVSNFPELDPLLDETTLRLLFDWMVAEACCRTKSNGVDELVRWQIANGDDATADMLDGVAADAVDRLPRPVLQVIDAAQGRTYAAILIEHSIAEAGARVS